MNVILEASLFEHGQTGALELLNLIYLGFEGRHIVTTDPLRDARVTRWLEARAPSESASCQFAFDSAVKELSRTEKKSAVRVRQGQSNPSLVNNEIVLSVHDALKLLRSPFRILLENEISDGNFILAIARPEWRSRLQDMRDKGWLCFEHGAGITRMYEVVGQCLQDPLSTFGIWLLFDSDSLAPNRPSVQATDLIGLCHQRIAFHCLERRAIENYLPLAALEHWAQHDRISRAAERLRSFRAFRSMAEPCKFHYNLKRGFTGDSGRNDLENVGSLYDGVSDQDRLVLNHGFGDQIADLFERYEWANWEWWMDSGRERQEGARFIQQLFSIL